MQMHDLFHATNQKQAQLLLICDDNDKNLSAKG